MPVPSAMKHSRNVAKSRDEVVRVPKTCCPISAMDTAPAATNAQNGPIFGRINVRTNENAKTRPATTKVWVACRSSRIKATTLSTAKSHGARNMGPLSHAARFAGRRREQPERRNGLVLLLALAGRDLHGANGVAKSHRRGVLPFRSVHCPLARFLVANKGANEAQQSLMLRAMVVAAQERADFDVTRSSA